MLVHLKPSRHIGVEIEFVGIVDDDTGNKPPTRRGVERMQNEIISGAYENQGGKPKPGSSCQAKG